MIATFYLWNRSLRHIRQRPSDLTAGSTSSTTNSLCAWPVAALAGVTYALTAATWGGHTFAANLIAVHTALMMARGKRAPPGMYRAYTLFYLVGNLGAMMVGRVGNGTWSSGWGPKTELLVLELGTIHLHERIHGILFISSSAPWPYALHMMYYFLGFASAEYVCRHGDGTFHTFPYLHRSPSSASLRS